MDSQDKPSRIIGGTSKEITLNKRQHEFVKDVIQTGDIEKSGERVFGDAKLGITEAQNPEVSSAIKVVLDQLGLTDESLVGKLKEQIEAPTRKPFASDTVNALKMAFELKGSFPAKKLDVTSRNINVDVMSEMSLDDLKKMLKGILDDE